MFHLGPKREGEIVGFDLILSFDRLINHLSWSLGGEQEMGTV